MDVHGTHMESAHICVASICAPGLCGGTHLLLQPRGVYSRVLDRHPIQYVDTNVSRAHRNDTSCAMQQEDIGVQVPQCGDCTSNPVNKTSVIYLSQARGQAQSIKSSPVKLRPVQTRPVKLRPVKVESRPVQFIRSILYGAQIPLATWGYPLTVSEGMIAASGRMAMAPSSSASSTTNHKRRDCEGGVGCGI